MTRREVEPLELSERERRFVEAYLGAAAGNGAEAVRLAGYRARPDNAKRIAYELMRSRRVRDALERLADEDPLTMRRVELRRWWTACVRGESVEGTPAPPLDLSARDRLRASELLARSSGMLIDRHALSAPDGGPVRVEVSSWTDLVRLAMRDGGSDSADR